MTRVWYNLHQVRFWYILHQVRFWVNLHQIRFWSNLHQAQNRKIGKPNNLKVFGSNKTKGPKQDSQNQLKSHMP